MSWTIFLHQWLNFKKFFEWNFSCRRLFRFQVKFRAMKLIFKLWKFVNFAFFEKKTKILEFLTFWSGSEPLEVLCWIWDWYIWDVRFRLRFFGVIFSKNKFLFSNRKPLFSQFWGNSIGNWNGHRSGFMVLGVEIFPDWKKLPFWKLMSI